MLLNEATSLLTSASTIKMSELKSMIVNEHDVSLLRHDKYNMKRYLKGALRDKEECERRVKQILDDDSVVQ